MIDSISKWMKQANFEGLLEANIPTLDGLSLEIPFDEDLKARVIAIANETLSRKPGSWDQTTPNTMVRTLVLLPDSEETLRQNLMTLICEQKILNKIDKDVAADIVTYLTRYGNECKIAATTIETFVDHGMSVNVCDIHGDPLLLLVGRTFNSLQLFDKLRKKEGAILYTPERFEVSKPALSTIFRRTLNWEHWELAQYLFEKHVDVSDDYDSDDTVLDHAWRQAACLNKWGVVKYLVSQRCKNGSSALHQALKSGNWEAVYALFSVSESVADVDHFIKVIQPHNWRALKELEEYVPHWMRLSAWLQTPEQLLGGSVTRNTKVTMGGLALTEAASADHWELVAGLLERNVASQEDRNLALINAVKSGNWKAVDTLFEHNTGVRAPLRTAFHKNNPKWIDQLFLSPNAALIAQAADDCIALGATEMIIPRLISWLTPERLPSLLPFILQYEGLTQYLCKEEMAPLMKEALKAIDLSKLSEKQHRSALLMYPPMQKISGWLDKLSTIRTMEGEMRQKEISALETELFTSAQAMIHEIDFIPKGESSTELDQSAALTVSKIKDLEEIEKALMVEFQVPNTPPDEYLDAIQLTVMIDPYSMLKADGTFIPGNACDRITWEESIKTRCPFDDTKKVQIVKSNQEPCKANHMRVAPNEVLRRKVAAYLKWNPTALTVV